MRDQEIVDLYEAYASIYASQEELTEEVEIAAQYFYEMGLNEDGVDILIEELGPEEFTSFVYNIAEEYYLTEARVGGVKVEPVTAAGKPFKAGKPTGKSLERLRAKKAARREAEASESEAKPSGLKASLQRQSAIASAKKQQPKKKGVLDRVAGAVLKGIERHNSAMGGLKKMGAATRETAGKVGKAAGEFKRGFVGEEVEEWVNNLLEDGYDLSEYTWDDMCEMYLDEARRADKEGHKRGTAANPNRNDTPHSDPSQRTRLHSRLRSRADQMGRERRNSPRYKQGGRPPLSGKEKAFLQASDRTSPGRGHVRNPNVPDTGSHAEWPSERRAQKDPKQNPKHNANRENAAESFDLYDIILSHLLDEGYAETQEQAEVIMVNMSEDWRGSIVESIARGSAPNSPTGNLGGIVSNLIKTGVDTLKKNVPSGGYSTRPGDGKPYKDGPLWDGGGPKTSPKPPIKPPKGPANRDEPLW